MKTTSLTPKLGRRIAIDIKSVPINYKAATKLFCQRYLSAALQMHSWNVTKCANALGISRRTLQLRMRQFDISLLNPNHIRSEVPEAEQTSQFMMD